MLPNKIYGGDGNLYNCVWVAVCMEEIMLFVNNMDVTSWCIILAVVLLFIIFYINKNIPFVKELVENVIVEAERGFNSGEGQLKLNYAVNNIREKLPFILRFFVTKSMVVTLVECTLRRISSVFDLDKDVDIKGNDSILKGNKIRMDENYIEIRSKDFKEIASNDEGIKDTEVYGGVKVSTDWRDKPTTTIELGVKKKL